MQRAKSGRSFTMAAQKHPELEMYPSSNHLGSAGLAMEEDHRHPVISLSKSFSDMASGASQQMELGWCRPHFHKSVSHAGSGQRPASMGGPVTVSLEPEQGGVCSGDSTTETVAWHGGITRPWSNVEPARRTPTQELFLGQQQAFTERCAPCSPSMPSDLRKQCVEGRETCCQGTGENLKKYNCSRMVYGVMSPALGTRPCLRSAHSLSQHTVDAEVCMQSPFKGENHHLSAANTCSSACVGNVLNTGSLRNTCAVVPCPGHLISLPTCTGSPCTGQRSVVHSALLGFPPLMSSVSETRLNRRAATHCCGSELGGKTSSNIRVDCTSQSRFCPRTVRDVSTMTSKHDFKEVGVQTMPADYLVSPLSNELPESCMIDGCSSDTCSEGVGTRTPVKEVEWDAEGMTWEVYGAAVDPEELGLAIQRHLELQIKETAAAAAHKKVSLENNGVSTQQSRRRRNSGCMVRSFRSSACCSCSTTVDD